MSQANNRRRAPGGSATETVLLAVLIGVVLAAVAAVNVGVRLGHRIDATGVRIPSDPFRVVFDVASGRLAWPDAGTWVLVALAAVLALAGAVVIVAVSRYRRNRTRVDPAAAYMGRGRDVEAQNLRSAQDSAQRLGVTTSPGVLVGRTVSGDRPLLGSWEDTHLDIWGPRTGKTTSRAVPAILDAPGAVLATSNKRDLVDATRDPRAAAGPVWVFDPQSIAGEEPTWWWNPLSYVTDEVKAGRLADHFASANTGDRKDAHFEDNGRDLLAGFLLAAALDQRPITAVYTWLTRPGDETPADIVRAAGFPLSADQLLGIAGAPEKERGSIYSTARRMTACLTFRHVAAWVTASSATRVREHFDPVVFVRSGGTLFSLSKEGTGSAGPLVMALTAAVVEAAEDLAAQSAGGRLSVPLLAVLDEAANVCRWKALPDLYSHYGSRGIILMTILQSWSQGVDVWGEPGMRKLWSAANIAVYGGGVREDGFLEVVSKLIGDYDRKTSTTSAGRGGRTVSHQLQRERILDVSDLGALPKGRAVVLASGSRPTLIRTQPWMTGPHAEAVRASITAHDPQAARTIREAETELLAVELAESARASS